MSRIHVRLYRARSFAAALALGHAGTTPWSRPPGRGAGRADLSVACRGQMADRSVEEPAEAAGKAA